MSRLKPYKFHELVKKLRRFDSKFEFLENRGKGSHRMIYHPDINGRAESYPVKCHGRGEEIDRVHIKNIKRRFNIPDSVL